MSRTRRRVLGGVVAILLGGGLALAFVEGREEIAREREREKPVKVPPRVSRRASGEVLVEIDAPTRERVGLVTAPLAAQMEPSVTTAFGRALDPGPLLALHAELSSAEAALAASRAEFERTRTLHAEGENASAQALEAAAAQLRADESRVRLAQRQIAASWGEDVAELATADREALAKRLVARDLVFVRASLPLGDELAGEPVGARVLLVGFEDRPLLATALREAPSIDPSAQGRTFLLRIEPGSLPLRPGAAVTALLDSPGEPRAGVVVPRASVVRFAGFAWAYVQVDGDHFARRTLPLDHPTSAGWFANTGFAPGDQVVVHGV